MSSPRTATLPNGRRVWCQRPEDALLMYQEVQDYVRHGMSLSPGATIVDVGANIGLFSLWAYDACGGQARILAFEPLPQVGGWLAHNLAQLGDAQVRVLPVGLAATPGEMPFYYYPQASYASTAYPDAPADDLALTQTLMLGNLASLPGPLPWLRYLPGPLRRGIAVLLARYLNQRQEVRVQMRRLSDVLREEGIDYIDLLKIDAEKAEWEVLQGIDAADWPRIRQVFVEVHDRDGRLEAICKLLRHQGFGSVIQEQDDFFRGTDIHAVYAFRN